MVSERRCLYGYQPKENFVLAVITLHNLKSQFPRDDQSSRRPVGDFPFECKFFAADKALEVLVAVIKRAHFYSCPNHNCQRAWPNWNRKQRQTGTLKIVRRPKSAQSKGCASFHISTQRRWSRCGWGELTIWEWLGVRSPPPEIKSRKWLSCCKNIKSSGERTL